MGHNVDEITDQEHLNARLKELLSACNIIKNVVKTRLELRKKQGDKAKICKRKVAQKLVKNKRELVRKF